MAKRYEIPDAAWELVAEREGGQILRESSRVLRRAQVVSPALVQSSLKKAPEGLRGIRFLGPCFSEYWALT